MEASQPSTPDRTAQFDSFELTLRTERENVREFLAAKQKQLDEAEGQLLKCLSQLADDLNSGPHSAEDACRDVDQRAAELAREAEHLERLRAELESRHTEWQQVQQQSARQQDMFLETLRREREALNEQFAALQRRHAEGAASEAAVNEHAASELETRRDEWRQIQQQAVEQQNMFLETLRREREALDERLAERLAALDRCREEGAARETALGEQAVSELEARRTEWQQIQQQTAEQQDMFLQTLRREREALDEQLAERLAALDRYREEGAARETASGEQAAFETESEFQRRYEMVLEDLREIKQENARLQEQLEAAQNTAPAAGLQSKGDSGNLSWEAQKQRILAALESEFDEEEEEDQKERLQIQQVVERTHRVVAEKDAEIAELKQLLENQSASVGSLAVGAAALGDMLDKDAVIQQERENLIQMQEEWREKLRKAEVEISVERAKLARERSKMEEQLRIIEERNAGAGDTSTGGSGGERPPRNRWLTRLGLKDEE